MIRSYRLLAMVSVISLHAANDSHIIFCQLDPSSISFSHTIESIYKAYTLHLMRSARSYEEKYRKKSSITQLYRVILGKTLTDLSALASIEIRYLCAHEDIQSSFDQACLHAKSSMAIQDRVASWQTFVSKLYDNRDAIIREKFPDIRLSQKEGPMKCDDFVTKNEHLVFDWVQGKYLIASQVIAFLPFALIQQHDPDAFVAFLEAREG